jgi:Flp pilus assembly protein TadG
MRRASDADLGKGQMLRFKARRADKGSMVSVVRGNASRRGRRRERESGQALVEFALIVPLFLMIVVGVIQFGVALNFWLDLQRLANQGARSAAVNCGTGSNQCGPSTWVPATRIGGLVSYLGSKTGATPEGQVVSSGNNPDVEICYVPPTQPPVATWQPSAGDAVRVSLNEKYRLQVIVGLAKIDLNAKATMRLEQPPTSAALPDRTDDDNWVLDSHTGTDSCKP